MTAETASPMARLLAAANDLIAEGLASCKRDNPTATATVMAHVASGAFPRIIIDTHPDITTVDFVLWGQDGEQLRVFQYRANPVDPLRH